MTEVRRIGRYALYEEIAAGGMATVHLARLLGPVGFSRTVAIKRLHATFARDPEFVSMFLDEARLAARIRHPNVVPTLDVVASQGELFLVMEYVHGEPLAQLVRACADAQQPFPLRIAVSLVSGALQGLHAAHEARDERGMSLDIVHRDVSPHNVMVGIDGMPRVLDFGVAKAAGRAQATRDGVLKGKIAYMAPEQVELRPVTRVADVYSASVVLWELLTGRRLFTGDSPAVVMARVLMGSIPSPASVAPHVPAALDAIVMRGLSRDPAARFATAREMALALDREASASLGETAEWLEHVAGPSIAARAAKVVAIESNAPLAEAATTSPSGAPGSDAPPRDAPPSGAGRSETSPSGASPADAPPSGAPPRGVTAVDGSPAGLAPHDPTDPTDRAGLPSTPRSGALASPSPRRAGGVAAAVLVAIAATIGLARMWTGADPVVTDPSIAAAPSEPSSSPSSIATGAAPSPPPAEPEAPVAPRETPVPAASPAVAAPPIAAPAHVPPRRASRPAATGPRPPSSPFDLGGRE